MGTGDGDTLATGAGLVPTPAGAGWMGWTWGGPGGDLGGTGSSAPRGARPTGTAGGTRRGTGWPRDRRGHGLGVLLAS